MRSTIAIILFIWSCHACIARTSIVRISSPNPPEGILLDDREFKAMMNTATKGFLNNDVNTRHGEVLTWAASVDNYGCPPRLFEEAILVLNVTNKSGVDEWALAHVTRMPGGGLSAGPWHIPEYPRPLLSFKKYDSRPSDDAIVEFLKASNYGNNTFYPDQRVIDIILYQKSRKIERVLNKSLTIKEKYSRYSIYVGSIAEPIIVRPKEK